MNRRRVEYVKGAIAQTWTTPVVVGPPTYPAANGRGQESSIFSPRFDGCEHGDPLEQGITLRLRAEQRPIGNIVLSIGLTNWSVDRIECDFPNGGTIWLPGDRADVKAYIEAPGIGFTPTEPSPGQSNKLVIYAEATRGRVGGDGTLRRTIIASDPVDATPGGNVYVDVPFCARRFQLLTSGVFSQFGSPGTSTVARVEGYDVNGALVCRWEPSIYANIMAIGMMGVEIPSTVQKIGLIGDGNVPTPNVFSTFVFQLGV